MLILAHAMVILFAGYLIARIIGVILARLPSPAHASSGPEVRKNIARECPVQLMGRLTFCLAMLTLLFIFSDVLNLLTLTGGVSTMPIYGPNGQGLLPSCVPFGQQPLSSGSRHPDP